MAHITFNLITEDPKNDELVVYLVEGGTWNGALHEHLKKLQSRLYDAFDAVVDGALASKYPESKGRRIRIQVDCHNSPPETVLNLVRKFAAFIHDSNEYQKAIRESSFVTDVHVVNGSDFGRHLGSGVMLTKTEALELVSKELQQRHSIENACVVVDKYTIKKAFGWIFFYNSKKFVETGIYRHRLAGNGPVIVNKHTGSIDFFGSNKPPEDIIKDYERKLAEDS